MHLCTPACAIANQWSLPPLTWHYRSDDETIWTTLHQQQQLWKVLPHGSHSFQWLIYISLSCFSHSVFKTPPPLPNFPLSCNEASSGHGWHTKCSHCFLQLFVAPICGHLAPNSCKVTLPYLTACWTSLTFTDVSKCRTVLQPLHFMPVIDASPCRLSPLIVTKNSHQTDVAIAMTSLDS